MNEETINALLSAMLKMSDGVSDLLFVPDKPPLVEIHGHLHEFPVDTKDSLLDAAQVKKLADHLVNGNERLLWEFDQLGSCDCSYAIDEIARFRVNIFKQNGRHAIVMRKLASDVPTLESLELPPVFREMLKEKNGIILITGGTGMGKTTTLAAIVDALNKTQEIHIVTLEDPVEFQHRHQKAVVNQRELGKDFPTFADGLRAALRQAPKVILVGEIRDRASMEIAMSAAETGHLVLSTLHTVNAGQTIHRILGMFPREEETQLRQRVSENIRYIVSQRLVSKIGGGRLLVTEVMGSSLRTREAIVYGESESKTFIEMMEAGSTLGWHTFDQSLLAAVGADLITEETTLMYCTNKGRMRRDLDILKKRRGASETEAPSGLKLNIPEPIAAILEAQRACPTVSERA
jgi:twitching motility protein PilT